MFALDCSRFDDGHNNGPLQAATFAARARVSAVARASLAAAVNHRAKFRDPVATDDCRPPPGRAPEPRRPARDRRNGRATSALAARSALAWFAPGDTDRRRRAS